jgi:hypothetical protein
MRTLYDCLEGSDWISSFVLPTHKLITQSGPTWTAKKIQACPSESKPVQRFTTKFFSCCLTNTKSQVSRDLPRFKHMMFRLKPAANRSLEPFAVFAIAIGLGQITTRITTDGSRVVTATTVPLLIWFWALGAAGALAYSIVVLRYMLRAGVPDRALYLINAFLYFALLLATPLVKFFGWQHS